MSSVWVFVENRDGKVSTIAKEAIGAARMVADELSEDLVGLVFGEDVADAANAAFDLGCDEVMGCDDETLRDGRLENNRKIQFQRGKLISASRHLTIRHGDSHLLGKRVGKSLVI